MSFWIMRGNIKCNSKLWFKKEIEYSQGKIRIEWIIDASKMEWCQILGINKDPPTEKMQMKYLVIKQYCLNTVWPCFHWGKLKNGIIKLCPECSAMGMGQSPICKLKCDLLRTSITACTVDKDTFSAPFGIFDVRTEI